MSIRWLLHTVRPRKGDSVLTYLKYYAWWVPYAYSLLLIDKVNDKVKQPTLKYFRLRKARRRLEKDGIRHLTDL